MADIELVIKLPEEEYEYCKTWELMSPIAKASVNGTQLPKGHGELIDRSEVIKNLFDYHNGKKTIGQCIDDVPTIIEADEEEDQ